MIRRDGPKFRRTLARTLGVSHTRIAQFHRLMQLTAPVRNALRQEQHLTKSALRKMLRAGHEE